MSNRSHCEDFFEIAVFRHYVVADRQNITRFLNLCTFLSDLWLKLAMSSCRLSPTHLPNKFWEKTLLVAAGWVDLLEYLVIVYSSSTGLFRLSIKFADQSLWRDCKFVVLREVQKSFQVGFAFSFEKNKWQFWFSVLILWFPCICLNLCGPSNPFLSLCRRNFWSIILFCSVTCLNVWAVLMSKDKRFLFEFWCWEMLFLFDERKSFPAFWLFLLQKFFCLEDSCCVLHLLCSQWQWRVFCWISSSHVWIRRARGWSWTPPPQASSRERTWGASWRRRATPQHQWRSPFSWQPRLRWWGSSWLQQKRLEERRCEFFSMYWQELTRSSAFSNQTTCMNIVDRWCSIVLVEVCAWSNL